MTRSGSVRVKPRLRPPLRRKVPLSVTQKGSYRHSSVNFVFTFNLLFLKSTLSYSFSFCTPFVLTKTSSLTTPVSVTRGLWTGISTPITLYDHCSTLVSHPTSLPFGNFTGIYVLIKDLGQGRSV